MIIDKRINVYSMNIDKTINIYQNIDNCAS